MRLEMAAKGGRSGWRCWWLRAVVYPPLAVAVGMVLWRLWGVQPFKLIAVSGAKADWMGKVKGLAIGDVDDPSGRYLYLQGSQGVGAHASIWQFDLEREEIVAEITGAPPPEVEGWYDQLFPENLTGDKLTFIAYGGPNYARRTPDPVTEWLRRRCPWWPAAEKPSIEPRQTWTWDSERHELRLERRVSNTIPWVSRLSPDGKRWLCIGAKNTVEIRDSSRGGLRAEFPLATALGYDSLQLHWLADSKSFVIFDDIGVRWIDAETRAVRWEQTHAELVNELAAETELEPEKAKRNPRVLPWLYPGVYLPQVVHDGGRMLMHVTAVRDFQQLGRPDAEKALSYIWELPANVWKPLGKGFSRGASLDRLGRFRIDFVNAGGADGAVSDVVRTAPPVNGSGEVLARGVPAAGYSQVVPNPDRLYWLTEKHELWVLALDGKSEARRVWPRTRGTRDEGLGPREEGLGMKEEGMTR